MKVVREEKTKMNNNESVIKRAVYQNESGSFTWMTYTRSGECKKIETAMRKAGF